MFQAALAINELFSTLQVNLHFLPKSPSNFPDRRRICSADVQVLFAAKSCQRAWQKLTPNDLLTLWCAMVNVKQQRVNVHKFSVCFFLFLCVFLLEQAKMFVTKCQKIAKNACQWVFWHQFTWSFLGVINLKKNVITYSELIQIYFHIYIQNIIIIMVQAKHTDLKFQTCLSVELLSQIGRTVLIYSCWLAYDQYVRYRN